MADFKVGDVVQLKSGGPTMTVTGVGPQWISCTWFGNGQTAATEGGFPPAALKLHDPTLIV